MTNVTTNTGRVPVVFSSIGRIFAIILAVIMLVLAFICIISHPHNASKLLEWAVVSGAASILSLLLIP